MAIIQDDINLKSFLQYFCPTSMPEQGKITLTDGEFLQVAALLKIAHEVQANR